MHDAALVAESGPGTAAPAARHVPTGDRRLVGAREAAAGAACATTVSNGASWLS